MSGDEKLFIFHSPMTQVSEFKQLAASAAKLRKHGRVLVNISELADKSWFEIPEGGSPWHEYACYNPTPFKFFPHEKIAPHLPADWVERNRELLLAKTEVLQKLDIEAAFWGYEPNILPESFFEEFPHLRGARVDHPRRSCREAFAMCADLPEVLDMTASMVAELKRNVPNLGVFMFKTNDAGSGLCWSENIYSGPNGPKHCQSRGVGRRARGLLEAIHRGAIDGGGDVDVHMSGYITGGELEKIQPHLPPRSWLRSRDNSSMGVGSMIDAGGYPVQGMVNPLSILQSMERYDRPETKNVFVSFRASYDRGHDLVETTDRVVEIVDDWIERPCKGLLPRLTRLRELSERWAGSELADDVFESFVSMDQAFKLKSVVGGRFSPYTGGVSARFITRPLVIKPDLLTDDEEAYWLPHVFNIHESEARDDYIDSHGGRMYSDLPGLSWDPRVRALHGVVAEVARCAEVFGKAQDGPAGEWFRHQWLGLRMWCSFIKSCNNFYGGQIIRDHNRERLAGEPTIPSKEATWHGDQGIIEWNELQREEFDNVNELISILEEGGLELLCRAEDPRHEDTFLLGPDIVDQLKKKAAIMRRHWCDIEKYFATPFK